MKKTNKNLLKTVILPVFSLVVVVALLVFFLVPRIQEVLATRNKVKDQEAQINTLTTKLNDLNSLSIPELTDSANLLLEALPQDKDFYRIITTVIGIFSNESALVKSYKINPGLISSGSASAEIKDSGNSLTVSVNFSLPFERLESLLTGLEKTLPLTMVDSFGFASSVATSGATIESDFIVRSYFSPLPATLPKIDKPLPKISSDKKQLIEKLKTYSSAVLPLEMQMPQEVIVGKDNPFSI